MTKRMKTTASCLLAAVLALLWAGEGRAAYPEPDSDSLTISLTPSVDVGVDVATDTTRFSLSDVPGDIDISLALGATAYFLSPASVTILGNFNNQEVQVQAQALDNWQVDSDQNAEPEKAQLFVLFGNNKVSHPTEAEFDSDSGRHQVTTVAQTAGQAVGDEAASTVRNSNRYEINDGSMAGWGEMDNLAVNTVRQLWLRVDAPPFSEWSGAQRLMVTVTAVTGVTN